MPETMTPEEIKGIRAQYGLTQKSFATLLGIGTASMVRYEQGAQPSKANANLIRAARHPEFMAECLQRDGDLIPERQRKRAMECSYALVSLNPAADEAAAEQKPKPHAKSTNRMTEAYHYTLQQEVLNEQAANLSCDMMNYLIGKQVDINDTSSPMALLLRQLLDLKRSLITEAANDDEYLEQIRGHLRFMSDFLEQLNRSEEVA